MRDALVLSGGGARGAYQTGVLAALGEGGYRPDLVVGTSIGALNGAAFTGGADIADLVRLWSRLRTRDVLRPRLPLRGRPGLYGADRLRDLMESTLDWDRVGTRGALAVTAVDVQRRRPVVWRSPGLRALHLLASTALPPALPPVEIDGRPHVDGGIWQNPPLAPALESPVERLVVVCHEPVESHAEDVRPSLRGHAAALSDVVWHARSQAALTALRHRMRLPRRDPERARVGTLGVIAPTRSLVPDILRFDPDEARTAIEEGRRDARAWLAR